VILLAGGTGRLGTLLTGLLAGRDLQVRILTRHPQHARQLVPGHVTAVRGDVRNRESLRCAMAGVDLVVSAIHGFADTARHALAEVDRDGNANLAEAAEEAGAELVVMSTVGAAADSPLELFRMKDAAERRAAASNVPTTIVRATAFLELWIELLERTAGRSGRPLVFGRGENPINFVSVGDVAALVEQVVIDPATRGTTLEIGGPADFTFVQLAHAVAQAAGRSAVPRHVPPAVLSLMATTIGRVKPQLGRQARAALAMDSADLSFDATPIRRLYPQLPYTTLADVLSGRPAARTADPGVPVGGSAGR
jgi:uncharacterized protein YbjT (DUF2867 family)